MNAHRYFRPGRRSMWLSNRVRKAIMANNTTRHETRLAKRNDRIARDVAAAMERAARGSFVNMVINTRTGLSNFFAGFREITDTILAFLFGRRISMTA